MYWWPITTVRQEVLKSSLIKRQHDAWQQSSSATVPLEARLLVAVAAAQQLSQRLTAAAPRLVVAMPMATQQFSHYITVAAWLRTRVAYGMTSN